MLCIDFAPRTISIGVSNQQLSSATPLRDQLGNRLLVLFDGHCALCHASVRWLLRHDRHDRLLFAAAESAAARVLLAEDHLPSADSALPSPAESVLVLMSASEIATPARLLARSAAVLACLDQLPAPWPQLAALARRIPLPLRDAAYRLVARFRFRLARRLDTCPLPTPEDIPHFL